MTNVTCKQSVSGVVVGMVVVMVDVGVVVGIVVVGVAVVVVVVVATVVIPYAVGLSSSVPSETEQFAVGRRRLPVLRCRRRA